jgi:hypothetical protein
MSSFVYDRLSALFNGGPDARAAISNTRIVVFGWLYRTLPA